jgi:hypothetical protein
MGVALNHQRPFHALLTPVDRGRAGDLATARGLGDAPVDGDLIQQQAHDAVVGLQRDLLELGEQSGFDPFIAAVADRARRAGRVGDRLVGAAEPQHLDELVEHDPVADASPVAAQRMRGVDHWAGWDQRGELVPQGVGQP